jgi:hypothetical protein
LAARSSDRNPHSARARGAIRAALLGLALLAPRDLAAHELQDCLHDVEAIGRAWGADESPIESAWSGVLVDSTLHLLCLSHDARVLGIVSATVSGAGWSEPRVEPNPQLLVASADQVERLAAAGQPRELLSALLAGGKIDHRSLLVHRRRDRLLALWPEIAALTGAAGALGATLTWLAFCLYARGAGEASSAANTARSTHSSRSSE